MKKTLLILIACLLPLMAMAQEKKEMKLELKNGTTLTGLVTVQQDGSYILENTSGDVFYFDASEVRKATVIFESPVSQTADLNDYYGGKTVYKKGGSLRFYANNEKLTQKDFADFQSWQKYQKAQKNINTSNKLLITAGGLVLVGGVITGVYLGISESFSGSNEEYYNLQQRISWMAPAGGVPVLAAIPVAITSMIFGIVGNTKLKKMADAYNQSPGYVLDFGAQQNGVGFALKF